MQDQFNVLSLFDGMSCGQLALNRAGIKYDNYYASVELDRKYWNYSNTTGKYRNIFLNETITETKKKIKSGEYKLTDLNSKPVYNDTVETINLNK